MLHKQHTDRMNELIEKFKRQQKVWKAAKEEGEKIRKSKGES